MSDTTSDNPNRKRQQVYAIVRIDEFQGPNVPIERKMTVKEIVWTETAARTEVDRLNRLQSQRDVDCRYYYQATRLEPTQLMEESDAKTPVGVKKAAG
jgi:hypothetical protein